MMKRCTSVLLTMLLLLCFSLPLTAADLPLVYDETGQLTADQTAELSKAAQQLADTYGCEPSVAIIHDKGAGDVLDVAQKYYETHQYGSGPEKDGIFLFVSMKEGDVGLLTMGKYADGYSTDAQLQTILNDVVMPKLSEGQFYEAVQSFFQSSMPILEAVQVAKAPDVEPAPASVDDPPVTTPAPEESDDSFWWRLAAVILLPLLIAGGVCYSFYQQMRTAKSMRTADAYMTEEGVNITASEDHYIRTTETRTKIEKKDN